MRAMRWKAPQFIEFAAEQKLDAVLINNLPLFESREESYLRGLKETADRHGLRIYMGAGSICENGSSFNNRYGDAKTFLAEGIRVATIVGSPVVTVRIGKLADRYLEGGIGPRIDASVKVLKALKSRALDAGVKFGFASFNASASRNLPYEAASAVGFGLPYEEALRAITINSAEILGVGDQLGTIETGKIANIIVTDGDPLEIQTQILHLVINGLISSIDNKHKSLYEKYRARPER